MALWSSEHPSVKQSGRRIRLRHWVSTPIALLGKAFSPTSMCVEDDQDEE